MPERQPEFPLHRLNTPQTKMWLISPAAKQRIALALSRMYRGGVGVCAATLRFIAFVDPRGAVRELPPPHKRYEMWQIANRPGLAVCPCANFFDPEVQGAYRERGSAEHHPMCQFDRTAQDVFKHAMHKAADRIGLQFAGGVPIIGTGDEYKASVIKPLTPQARPDEWEKIRKEYRGQ